MDTYLIYVAKALILPPGGNFILMALGLVLLPFARRSGRILLAFGGLSLVLLSLPGIAMRLAAPLERVRVVAIEELHKAGAIVVLAGGRNTNAPEYGGETVADITLRRLRYGVRLARASGLPMLVTGGRVFGGDVPSEAELMAESLREDFGFEPRWLETDSRNTAENARYSAQLLKAAGIDSIVLVSDAMHLARAMPAFESTGLHVVPAPTAFQTVAVSGTELLDWLPSPGALAVSRYALHELLGRAYYRWHYGI